MQARAVRRLGRDSMMLELDIVEPDGTERLLVFGRLDLGDDPWTSPRPSGPRVALGDDAWGRSVPKP